MDVIALHAAGFENAVAPLGTALTERQMALLWRIHDEPLLCFDGDGAGLKAAYRAVDMVMPMLEPGKSVRFAMLPEGKDPDDLIREEGSEAMRQVLNAALPLSDMLWNREIASGSFDTPERRAELETRLKRLTGTIRNESVRRHYEESVRERLNNYFRPDYSPSVREFQKPGHAGKGYGAYRQRGSGRQWQPGKARPGSNRVTASPSLLSSKLVKKSVSGMSLREAALVGGLVFHPSLCVQFFEEASGLVFASADAKLLQSAVLDVFARLQGEENYPHREQIEAEILKRDLSALVEGLYRQLNANKLWQVLPEAAFEDARDGWQQAYLLHLKNQTLNEELKAAERALADDDSQENLERMLQLQQELCRVDGIEALIDGFGVPSGRPAKGF